MISDRERMMEWLRRSAEEIKTLRKKPRMKKEAHLNAIRQNYGKISVLIKVVEGKAFMMGIAPPPNIP